MITLYHIPVCPFCQRIEILTELKGLQDRLRFEVVDITKPRDAYVLELADGSTTLPVMELDDGRALRESLVLMNYIDDKFPGTVRRADPYERAIENLLVSMENAFVNAGYIFVMNGDRSRRDELRDIYLAQLQALNAFLERYSVGDGPFLFDDFGWAEAVFTPIFQRFWFIEYYEGVDIPDEPGFARVRAWRDACVVHPSARQTSREEVVKLYYDYALGAGNGAIPEGRKVSSFTFEPDWRERPWPPREKYGRSASDAELGLI